MNYYYEIDPKYDGTIFGDKWRYWCMANCSPADNGKMCFKTHDEFVARRVVYGWRMLTVFIKSKPIGMVCVAK